MFGKKGIGFGDVVLVDGDLGMSQDFLAKKVANPVVDSVADDGCQTQKN